MTIELTAAVIIAIASLAFNVFQAMRKNNKDDKDEAKAGSERSTAVIVKLESISDDLKEIKVENRTTTERVNAQGERLAVAENSIKSLHKRMDKVEGVQKE
ncbi:MAG: hypothetical protein Q4G60_03190 [bacterium]|nr:hypothetical protein [bacterium]